MAKRSASLAGASVQVRLERDRVVLRFDGRSAAIRFNVSLKILHDSLDRRQNSTVQSEPGAGVHARRRVEDRTRSFLAFGDLSKKQKMSDSDGTDPPLPLLGMGCGEVLLVGHNGSKVGPGGPTCQAGRRDRRLETDLHRHTPPPPPTSLPKPTVRAPAPWASETG